MSFSIYKLDQHGYIEAGPLVIEDHEGAPDGWYRLPEAATPPGQYAQWRGEWVYVTDPPPTPLSPVPEKVSNLQARAALRMQGLFASVKATIEAVAAGDPDNGVQPQEAMLDYWNFASEFHRNHWGIAIIANLMGWSSEFVDNLFREAITYY